MFFLLKIGGLVVLAIIFIVIFTVGRVLFMANKVKRNFKNTMNNAGFGGQQRQQVQQPQSKKVYTKDMGEYVKFEDVVEDETVAEEPRKEQYNNVKAESQISDVEFEEIK